MKAHGTSLIPREAKCVFKELNWTHSGKIPNVAGTGARFSGLQNLCQCWTRGQEEEAGHQWHQSTNINVRSLSYFVFLIEL